MIICVVLVFLVFVLFGLFSRKQEIRYQQIRYQPVIRPTHSKRCMQYEQTPDSQ